MNHHFQNWYTIADIQNTNKHTYTKAHDLQHNDWINEDQMKASIQAHVSIGKHSVGDTGKANMAQEKCARVQPIFNKT